MNNTPFKKSDLPTRRCFAQSLAAGAASLAIGSQGFAGNSGASSRNGTSPQFQLGVHSYSFIRLPLERALAMTVRAGLKYISLSDHLPVDAKPEQIERVVAQCKAAGVALYGAGVVDMRSDAEVEQAFVFAKAAGLKTIICKPRPEVLGLIDRQVRKHDIRAAIHNHGPGDDLYPKCEIAYEKVRHLDRRVGLCIDIGHAARIGDDPARAIERFADRLLDVHFKDVTAAAPAGVGVEIGRGVIDIPAVLRSLLKIGYSGVASFEFDKDPLDPLPCLAESVGYVRGALASITKP